MLVRLTPVIERTDYFLTGAAPDEVWPLVRSHHYSRRMPGNIQHCCAARGEGGLFGNNGEPLAAVVFSIPPTRWGEELIELTRLVRVPAFSVPLSHLISFACSQLRKQGWVLAVSFADQQQGHHGGVYQAAGWHYDGRREPRMDGLLIDGVFKPGRSCNSQYGTQSPDKLRQILPSHTVEPHYDNGKHLYWKPLAIAGRSKARRLGLKALPYPKPDIAARPLDERLPRRVSDVQPVGAAP
ncbi:MAG: mom [Bradyrhizobium sp.]|nr:mom [Bradyrhizobium sp.]